MVLATARPPRGVTAFQRELGLVGPSIHYNGALIHDTASGRHLHHRPLPAAVAARAVAVARGIDRELVVQVETLDRWLTDRVDRALFVATNVGSEPDFLGPIEACLVQDPTKVMLLAEPDRLRPVRAAVEAAMAGAVELHISDEHCLQLVAPGVDKGEALAWWCGRAGVAAAEVLAIGDAPNDAAMLRWAGLGVAVANAWPEARAAADASVASNDDDGVAEAIERWVR